MVGQENQPALYDAIELLFQRPPWTQKEKKREYDMHHSHAKGHGRRETRTLESSATLTPYLDWPGLAQALRRRCRRVNAQTGEERTQTRYGITSLSRAQADAAQLEQLWRGHWAIENRVHYVRDVTLGADARQVHVGAAPHALATLRNALLNLLRGKGWQNIANAIRYYAAPLAEALTLIGLTPRSTQPASP